MNRIGKPLEIDEPMSPNEHAIHGVFFSKDNTLRVHRSAQTHVSASLSFATVVDAMHKEFSLGLGGRVPVDVESLNQSTINSLYDSHQKHLLAVAQSREVGFENSRIPTTLLPRASFQIQPETGDMVGKTQILLR